MKHGKSVYKSKKTLEFLWKTRKSTLEKNHRRKINCAAENTKHQTKHTKQKTPNKKHQNTKHKTHNTKHKKTKRNCASLPKSTTLTGEASASSKAARNNSTVITLLTVLLIIMIIVVIIIMIIIIVIVVVVVVIVVVVVVVKHGWSKHGFAWCYLRVFWGSYARTMFTQAINMFNIEGTMLEPCFTQTMFYSNHVLLKPCFFSRGRGVGGSSSYA